jgi:hypothetical protein
MPALQNQAEQRRFWETRDSRVEPGRLYAVSSEPPPIYGHNRDVLVLQSYVETDITHRSRLRGPS